MVFRVQYTTRAQFKRAQDVEDAGWRDLPGIWEDEQAAETEARDLQDVAEGRSIYRVIGFDLVRAA